MGHANTSHASPPAVPSVSVPRKPRTAKASEKIIRVTLLLPAADVRAVDAAATRRTARDAYKRTVTRSDVIRQLLARGLREEERDARVANEDTSTLVGAAKKLAHDWLKVAKRGELNKADRYLADPDTFAGVPQAPQNWWTILVNEFPTMKQVTDENREYLPAVDDEVRAMIEDDNVELRDFCEAFLNAALEGE